MTEDDDTVTVSWSKKHFLAVCSRIKSPPDGVDLQQWQGVTLGMVNRPWVFNNKTPDEVFATVLATVRAIPAFLAAEGAKS